MSLTAAEQTALRDLVRKCKPVSGTYFRSVERRFMDPMEVLNGPTALSSTEDVLHPPAREESIWRTPMRAPRQKCSPARSGSGGASQISLDKYPRVVFAVDAELERVASLVRKPRNHILAAVWKKSAAGDIGYSQEVGEFLASAGIQALLFKSAIRRGTNLLVFLDNCTPGQLKLRKLDETIKAFRQIVSHRKP